MLPQDLVVREDDERSYAFRLEHIIVETVGELRKQWVVLASALWEFHDRGAWETLGYETLEEWLAGPDIELSRSQFFQLISIHQELVIDRKVAADRLGKLDMTKVQEVLPAIRRQQADLEDALDDVEVLSRRDLRERYKRAPGAGKVLDDPAVDGFHFEPCPVCNRPRKVMDDVQVG